MCGIYCQILCSSGNKLDMVSTIQQQIKNRGPDSSETIYEKHNDVNMTYCASVLWMQGRKAMSQPVVNNIGLLMFNGDIFDPDWDTELSDTEQISQRFTACTSSEEIVNQIKMFKGPFSLIYYSKLSRDLIFSRDRIGRNSMLFHKNNQNIILSSVLSRSYDCVEIPATYIYVLNLNSYQIKQYKWDVISTTENEYNEFGLDDWFISTKLLQSLPDEHFIIQDNIVIDCNEETVTTFIETVALETNNKETFMERLLGHNEINVTVKCLVTLLKNSIRIRLQKHPQRCKDCLFSPTACTHSSVGVLFSGGLDCTILAYLADKYVPKDQSIDLINVAFKKDDKSTYEVPDRLTGKQSLHELRELCPNRKWIFKEVNVSVDVLTKQQENVIADLVFPRQTILDESLGSALWFAAQGDDGITKSSCRVLILGSGADELFGGYTRHRNAYKRNGWLGLAKELQLDWKRISFRNLARDNRVICDHGRQPRMPYLDEEFTHYVLNLKPWFKCFPSDQLGIGVGDKLFLRLIAFHLGLRRVSVFPKRAIQFGSRIANKKEKGSDISKNFICKS